MFLIINYSKTLIIIKSICNTHINKLIVGRIHHLCFMSTYENILKKLPFIYLTIYFTPYNGYTTVTQFQTSIKYNKYICFTVGFMK